MAQLDSPENIQNVMETFPKFNWGRFWDIDRSLNWELWHGPLPGNYWTEVEPLEHYVWVGLETAANDLRDMLGELPDPLWKDLDGDCISITDPQEFEDYWEEAEPYGIHAGERVWVGGEWMQFSPRDLLYKEVRSYV